MVGLGLVLLIFSAQPSQASKTLTHEQLLAQLHKGGVVIYFRHGLTDWSQTDTLPLQFKACETQRNLNSEGRVQMKAIGKSMTTLAVPVGAVLSSPYCRTVESAKLAFGRADADSRLSYVGPLTRQARKDQVDRLGKLLGTPPPKGKNTVLIAHRGNLLEATQVDLEEGEAALFLPVGSGHQMIGRLTRKDWESLAAKNIFLEPTEEECREPNRLPSG